MIRLERHRRLLICLLLLGLSSRVAAQAPPPPPASLSVFLDCGFQCDEDFLKTEITFVDWVRERTEADVHVLVTSEPTGGGGANYTLAFLGLRRFSRLGDTLHYVSGATATADETRRGLARVMRVGFVPFVARTLLVNRLDISLLPAGNGDSSARVAHDPWNFWVFTTSLNGNANGDENNTFTFINGGFNARRTTDLWKVNLAANENYNQSVFTISDAKSSFIRRSFALSQLVVRSLDPRWSAGFKSSVGSSTFENKRFSYRLTPAVEYDIFPYSESTRRMLTLQYSAGVEGFSYQEVTIYDKLRESHPLHVLALGLSQNQPWGSANASLEGGQYLDMPQRNYATLFLGTNVRLYKGLNVNLGGNYSAIRNQLFLPRSGATPDEILTQQRQLATSYQFGFFFGLNYTFGSLLNSIVNPRFGRDNGGNFMIMF